MIPGLTIRFATISELPLVEQLARDIWPVTYNEILSPGQLTYMLELIYSQTALQQQFTVQRQTFLLVELDNKPIGFASYSLVEKPGIYKLHKIYVHPSMQGKGIGNAIIDFVIADIRQQQATTLLLNVNRYNKAKSFYEKLGFVVLREEDIDIGNNYFMNDYVMSYRL